MQITIFAELDLVHQIRKTHFSDLVHETLKTHFPDLVHETQKIHLTDFVQESECRGGVRVTLSRCSEDDTESVSLSSVPAPDTGPGVTVSGSRLSL